MKNLIWLVVFFAVGCSSLPSKTSSSYSGIGEGSLPEAVVAKFKAPAVEPELLSKVQKMMDVRGAGAGVLSKDGKVLFYTTSVTGTAQVWRMDGPMGFARQMTAGNDSTWVSSMLPNGKDLLIQRDRNGEENPGLYLQSVNGGPLRKIFHEKKIQCRLAYVTSDSKSVYFLANSERPESYALHRYDVASGKSEVVFNEPGTWHVADVRNDVEFLMRQSTGSLWSEFSVWNAKTKQLQALLGQGEKEEYDVSFARTPGEYLVHTPKFGDFRRLYLMRDGKFTALTPDVKTDVSNAFIDYPRERIYVSWNDRGYTRTEVLDARTYRRLAFPDFKDADHVYTTRVSRDGRFVQMLVETASSPNTLYVKDWSNAKVTKWQDPQLPEVDVSLFARAQLLSYQSRDGVAIPMFVRRSEACRKTLCPVIVDFHGGPEGQTIPGFRPSAQAFVDAGFIFVQPNIRGSDGYGKAWLASDDGPKRLQVITDIEDAAVAVKKMFAFEGKTPKVGVMGGSYGGYATLYAMTKFAGAYDAGAANVGMSNLITFLNNTAPYRRHLRISEYGDPVKDKDALHELSPINFIDRIKAPLMIIQGLNDPRVPAGEAVQIHDALAKKGIDAPLIIFPDEGHGAGKRDNRASQLGNTLKFFEKNLK